MTTMRGEHVGQHVAQHDARRASRRGRGSPPRTRASAAPAPASAGCGRRTTQPESPMTTTRVGKLGPSTAMMPMASRMNGNASCASATVMMIGVHAPAAEARRRAPSAEPSSAAHQHRGEADHQRHPRAEDHAREHVAPEVIGAEQMRPPVGAVRAWARESRPRSDLADRDPAGASQRRGDRHHRQQRDEADPEQHRARARGAARARRPRDRRRDATASAGADAGIEDAIDEVDEEVDHDEHERGQEDGALHHRVVAVVDRLHREPADARPREHGLGDDRAAQQGAELERR